MTLSLTPARMHFGTHLINTTSAPQTATPSATGTYQVTIQSISDNPPFNHATITPTHGLRHVQTELERTLGVRVRIRDRKGKGRIEIEYATLEDFDRVVGMLKGKG